MVFSFCSFVFGYDSGFGATELCENAASIQFIGAGGIVPANRGGPSQRLG